MDYSSPSMEIMSSYLPTVCNYHSSKTFLWVIAVVGLGSSRGLIDRSPSPFQRRHLRDGSCTKKDETLGNHSEPSPGSPYRAVFDSAREYPCHVRIPSPNTYIPPGGLERIGPLLILTSSYLSGECGRSGP